MTTNKRRYYFEYSASARRPNPAIDPVMYAVRFSYPPPHRSGDGLTDEQRVQLELERAQQSRPRNTDYWFCGDQSVKPTAASDDGVQTRLTFAARSELPALFVRNDDGTESLLNFSIEDGDVLIHRVARTIHRAARAAHGLHREQGLCGRGERLKSGTVAPDVDARAQGRAPVNHATPLRSPSRGTGQRSSGSAASPPSIRRARCSPA